MLSPRFIAIIIAVVSLLVASPAALAQLTSLAPITLPTPVSYKRAIFDNANDFQIWTPVYVWARHGKIRFMLDVQPREDISAGHMEQMIVRPAVGYQITPSVSLWQGYGFTPSWLPRYTEESRIFQQLLVEKPFKRFAMVNRTRLEERYIARIEPRTSVRLRHMLRFQVPIRRESNWSAVVFDELFINLNGVSASITPGLNQNRLFVGLNRKVNSHMNFDIGYQYQYIWRNIPDPDRNNHVLLMNINYVIN